MLFDHRKSIKQILNTLRDEINLTIIRMSEDPRNESLCEKFRAIRDAEITAACTLAHHGTEDSLKKAVESAQSGMIRMFEIHQGMCGYALDGRQLPPEEKLTLHPMIRKDREGEFEIIVNQDGTETHNYNVSIPFKEKALIIATLDNLFPYTCVELKACDADMSGFEDVYSKRYSSAPEIILKDSHYVNQLRGALQSTATRLESDKDDNHPNHHVSKKLRELDYRIEKATGNGLVEAVIAKTDPVRALSAPPPPSLKEIFKKWDVIFKELHELMHGSEIYRLMPLRNTQQCRLGMQGSIRLIRETLKRAVEDLEERDVHFPEYRSVAQAERER